jgi:hypothetical protein
MSTSAIGTVLDAIRAALVLRSGLSGVNVYTGRVSVEEAGTECIAFGGGTLTEIRQAMGGNKLETWEIGGETRVVKPWQGTTETTIKAARDRVLAIFAQVETHINDTYTGDYPDVEISAGDIDPTFGPEGWTCSLTFSMTIRALKNP